MQKFIVQREFNKEVRRFNLTRRTLEFKIKSIPEDADPVGWVKDAVNESILYATRNLNHNDQVGFSFCSKNFAKGEGWARFQEASEINTKDVWNVLNSIFQSNSMGFSTDTFSLVVTSVQIPAGRGKKHNRYNSFNEESAQRKGIVVIGNKDNLCLPRALVVGMAKTTHDSEYRKVRRDIGKEQTKRAQELLQAAEVTTPEEGCGIPELQKFQDHLKDFKITVYQYGRKGRDVIFEGDINAPHKINLLYHEGHYNVIVSLTAAFCCHYYCEDCHVPYDNRDRHKCKKTCVACQQSPPCIFQARVNCDDCSRIFKSATCFENHIARGPKGGPSVCEKIKQCSSCHKIVNREVEHSCGEIYCKICRGNRPANHQCYMLQDTGKPPEKGFLFVFYDLETMQDTVLEDGSALHVANLCVFKICCDKCIDSNDKQCQSCGDKLRVSMDYEKHNFRRMDPIEWFLNFVLFRRKHFKKVVVVAHNGQSFDHQFILSHIITKTDLKPQLIMRGTKIIEMSIGNVTFIDTINYFPMALSKLPKAFGLGEKMKKGYFPHLFNKSDNQNYVGVLPPIEYYSPETMMGTDSDDDDERKQFLKWYDEHKNTIFDFKKEIVEYCTSDVEILTLACLKFREDLLKTTNVDPFLEACTIASACHKVFRRNFLKPNTIGIIPKRGYRWRNNQSVIATQWLVWEEKERNINIVHAAKEQETQLEGLKVDGYCRETNQVFEFHGCYFHGHPECLKFNRDAKLHDDPTETLNNRYERTVAKTERLRQLGYEVIEMWECSFRRLLDTKQEIREYTSNHPLVWSTPLNPRDAFYGGRTGNCTTFYKAEPGEKIKYVDVCSLYPYVCKYGKFPVGHPKVYVGHESCSKLNLKETNGLIRCTILPPQNLYHPILPMKMNNKLMFVLCRACGEKMDQTCDCTHTPKERALTATWVLDEAYALSNGYEMIKIYEIWAYNVEKYDPRTKTGGLFTEMMNKFIQIKQQASGWPSNCSTDDKRNRYIQEFLNKENVKLEYSEIVSNPGLRSLAKLMLNSFWGKFGQRENQPKTVIVNNPEDFFALITNPSVYINSVFPINDDVLIVNYEYKEEAYDPMSTANVCLAAYTTTQARLELYKYLDMLGERVLYYDTDSVIYISKEGEPDIPLGNFLGEMTDELETFGEGSYITQFVSGGPKNYAFEVFSTNSNTHKSVVKVKGIKINFSVSRQINFDSIRDMVCNDPEPREIVCTNIRHLQNHEVITKTETKTYRPNSTKRVFSDHFSTPYGFKRKRQ